MRGFVIVIDAEPFYCFWMAHCAAFIIVITALTLCFDFSFYVLGAFVLILLLLLFVGACLLRSPLCCSYSFLWEAARALCLE